MALQSIYWPNPYHKLSILKILNSMPKNSCRSYILKVCIQELVSTVDVGRTAELIIRGYIGQHHRICPCANECPLGAAINSDKKIVENIDKTQHVYHSLPLLVGHAEKIYEHYIEKYFINTFIFFVAMLGDGQALEYHMHAL